QSWYLVAYMLLMTLVSYLRGTKQIGFPLDNIFIIIIGLFTCKIMLFNSLSTQQIAYNANNLKQEVDNLLK
ncbi:MAG: hypothetical protein K0R49_427, partial [Burkholderiales bacterium]|nr:hypothetical protein [Burkholderiales bacterium]